MSREEPHKLIDEIFKADGIDPELIKNNNIIELAPSFGVDFFKYIIFVPIF